MRYGYGDFIRGRMFMSCLREVFREFCGKKLDFRGLGGIGCWGSGGIWKGWLFLYWCCVGFLRILIYDKLVILWIFYYGGM